MRRLLGLTLGTVAAGVLLMAWRPATVVADAASGPGVVTAPFAAAAVNVAAEPAAVGASAAEPAAEQRPSRRPAPAVVAEHPFLSCAAHNDTGCTWAASHPEAVAAMVAAASSTAAARALLVPIHRTLDLLMVVACEGKKRGCIDGFVLPEQAQAYFDWAAGWSGGRLCETGFNAGHSAVAFLLGNRGSTVTSFDFMFQAYSASTLRWLQAVFGTARLRVVQGDTAKTLPRAAGTVRCDALSVDGAHNAKACRRDVEGLSRLLRDAAPVLMDDTAPGFERRNKGPADVWAQLVREGRVTEPSCREYGLRTQWRRGSKAKPRGWCVGVVREGLQQA